MTFSHTPESLTALTIELLRAEAHQRDVYIRPLAYKADEAIGVKLHGLRDELTIAALPFDSYMRDDTDVRVTQLAAGGRGPSARARSAGICNSALARRCSCQPDEVQLTQGRAPFRRQRHERVPGARWRAAHRHHR
jgi:branched-chain amino acid aminotransferase